MSSLLLPEFKPRRPACGLAAGLVLLLFGAAATAEEREPPAPASSSPSRTLPEVNVQGRRNPLEDSDRRLRELIEGATPCLGCDVKNPNLPPNFVERVVDTAVGAITPQASKPLSHDDNTLQEVDRSQYELRHSPNTRP